MLSFYVSFVGKNAKRNPLYIIVPQALYGFTATKEDNKSLAKSEVKFL